MITEQTVVNPALIEAIHIMRKENNEETVSRMLAEVMGAKFIVPVKQSKSSDGEVQVQFYTVPVESEKMFLMAFTDWQQVHLWKKSGEHKTVLMNFDDLAQIILDTEAGVEGFIVNPFGENVPFVKDMIDSMRVQKRAIDEQGFAQNQEEMQTYVDDCKEVPEGLLEALCEYLQGVKEVKAAFLRWMVNGPRESYLVCVDFDGDRETIFKGIADVATPFMKEHFLDLIPVLALGEGMLDDVTPFYQVDGYVLPEMKAPSAAVVENVFEYEDKKGCILGCVVLQSQFHVNDEVDVITASGRPAFKIKISDIEVLNTKVEMVDATAGEVRCGIFVDGHHADEFYAGLRLLKLN